MPILIYVAVKNASWQPRLIAPLTFIHCCIGNKIVLSFQHFSTPTTITNT